MVREMLGLLSFSSAARTRVGGLSLSSAARMRVGGRNRLSGAGCLWRFVVLVILAVLAGVYSPQVFLFALLAIFQGFRSLMRSCKGTGELLNVEIGAEGGLSFIPLRHTWR
jgi:hypothetical protein